jgi:hypothetical protein
MKTFPNQGFSVGLISSKCRVQSSGKMDKTTSSLKRRRRRGDCHPMMKISMMMSLRLRKLKD